MLLGTLGASVDTHSELSYVRDEGAGVVTYYLPSVTESSFQGMGSLQPADFLGRAGSGGQRKSSSKDLGMTALRVVLCILFR